jgi:hypothetical protein
MRNVVRFFQEIVALNVHRGVVDNAHKVHGVNALLCKLGRHDYEGTGFGRDERGLVYVEMACFYCGHAKRSCGVGVADAADVAETTIENIRRHEIDLRVQNQRGEPTTWVATGTVEDPVTGDLYRVQSRPCTSPVGAVDDVVDGRGRRRVKVVDPSKVNR